MRGNIDLFIIYQYNYFVIIYERVNLMTKLIKIGNSYGIRIPKVFIKKAHLEDAVIDLKLFKNGLLLSPNKTHRSNWDSAILRKRAKQEDDKQNTISLQKDFACEDMREWEW